jgi:hypothetical protein
MPTSEPQFVPVQPTYTRQNVLTGMVQLYVQPYNSTSPAALPADTVGIGTAWGGSWVGIGATDQGVSHDFSRKTVNVMVEEQQTPVDVLSDSTDVGITTDLAEDTLQTLLWAFGGGTITNTAPGTGTPGVSVLQISSALAKFSLGAEGTDPAGFWRRMLWQPVVSAGKVSAKYRRAASKRMYSTTFTYIDKLENLVIREMTAQGL